MDLRELNTYKWLDAQEVKPRIPPKVSPMEKQMQKKLNYKILDILDKL